MLIDYFNRVKTMKRKEILFLCMKHEIINKQRTFTINH